MISTFFKNDGKQIKARQSSATDSTEYRGNRRDKDLFFPSKNSDLFEHLIAQDCLQEAQTTIEPIKVQHYLTMASKTENILVLFILCRRFEQSIVHQAAPLNKKLKKKRFDSLSLTTQNAAQWKYSRKAFLDGPS